MVRLRSLVCASLILYVLAGCASVSQSLRGAPDIAPDGRSAMEARYRGKTCWLRYPMRKGEYADKFARAMVPEAGPRKKPYEVELPAWSKVTIKEILFGSGPKNFLTVVDEAGKTHYGLQLAVPVYTADEKSESGFEQLVLRDYEYAISRAVSFLSRDDQLKAYVEQYGESFGALVMEHKVAVGMPRAAVLDSWGRPDDVNRTVLEGVTTEQWIYGQLPDARYVYVRNDIVDGLQE